MVAMSDPLAALLTAEERWSFDQLGWIVLPRIFAPEQVATMRQLASAWLATPPSDESGSSREGGLPAPLEAYEGPLAFSTGADRPGTKAIRGVYHPQYGHRLFQFCAAHPTILRVVSGLQEADPCLANMNVMQIERDTDETIAFHGNLDPGDRYYEVRGGSDADDLNTHGAHHPQRYPFSSLVHVAVSLVDVPPGEGFLAVPGSHKRVRLAWTRVPPASFLLRAERCAGVRAAGGDGGCGRRGGGDERARQGGRRRRLLRGHVRSTLHPLSHLPDRCERSVGGGQDARGRGVAAADAEADGVR